MVIIAMNTQLQGLSFRLVDNRNSFIGGAAHSPERKMTLTGLETSLDMAFTLQGTSTERCI